MEVELTFDNFNKSYSVGEIITGKVNLTTREKFLSVQTITLTFTGLFTIKNTKVSPASINYINFYKKKVQVAEGKVITGSNAFPFKYPLMNEESPNCKFYETYHGVVVSSGYEMYADVQTSKGVFQSQKVKVTITVPGQGIKDVFGRKIAPYHFQITPEVVTQGPMNNNPMPKFDIDCHVDNVNCNIDQGFDGYVNIRSCSMPIKSVELQFMRNEQTNYQGGECKEYSEIQNLQIGDGDVNQNIQIPMFMIFPRIFSCATLEIKEVKIKFEMNVIVVFVNGLVITYNFPVNLWRG